MWAEIEVQNDVTRIVRVGLYGRCGLLKPSDTDPVGDDAFEVTDELVLLHVVSRHADGPARDRGSASAVVGVGWSEHDGNEVPAFESDPVARPVLGELLDDSRPKSRVGGLAEVEFRAIYNRVLKFLRDEANVIPGEPA